MFCWLFLHFRAARTEYLPVLFTSKPQKSASVSTLIVFDVSVSLIGLHICSFPTSVLPHGCLNRRNVFCLYSQQIFYLFFCTCRFSVWKQPCCLWWKEPVCFLFFLFLSSARLFKDPGRKRHCCYSAASTAGSHWKTPNASSLCRPSL